MDVVSVPSLESGTSALSARISTFAKSAKTGFLMNTLSLRLLSLRTLRQDFSQTSTKKRLMKSLSIRMVMAEAIVEAATGVEEEVKPSRPLLKLWQICLEEDLKKLKLVAKKKPRNGVPSVRSAQSGQSREPLSLVSLLLQFNAKLAS